MNNEIQEVVFQEKPKNPSFQDLTEQKFNRLTVLGFAGKDKRGNSLWFCLCDCGTIKRVCGQSLKRANTISCGCYKVERIKETNTIHGHCKNREASSTYKTWLSLKDRCNNPGHKQFKDYGGRGITVCPRWEESFENFLEDMGVCPTGMTLDRIENDKGYYEENCRWANGFVQANNRRNNHLLTFQNKTQTIAQWSDETGVNRHTICARISRYGWSVERALTTIFH